MEAKDVSQKASFVHFVQAMGEELEGDVEEAVDIYLKVEMPFFRRIALNKVLNIKIKQEKYDEALLVLEALCGYSLDFMLPYADMLNLLGNRAAAMEVLGMYISQKPKAIDARIKLAQWQIEANQTAQAQQTLNQVIDLNPENKAAAHLMSLFNHGYKGVE
jgi:predicted Zn-dependent protease